MRSVTLISLLLVTNQFLFAQNVGINKTNPTEALDVKGNINVETGTIKVNGTGGGAGQVLSSNGNNGLVWSSLPSSAKNIITFQAASGFQYFTVPMGVTMIYFEGWSGGGYGSYVTDYSTDNWFSGGSGGYVKGAIAVTPGSVIKIRVPLGQVNASGRDSLYIQADPFSSLSMRNAINDKGASAPRLTGAFANQTSFIEGEDGLSKKLAIELQTDNLTRYSYNYPGGAAAPNGGKGGRGSYLLFWSSGVKIDYMPAGDAKTPGGGAALNMSDDTSPTVTSTKAGHGMLIFQY